MTDWTNARAWAVTAGRNLGETKVPDGTDPNVAREQLNFIMRQTIASALTAIALWVTDPNNDYRNVEIGGSDDDDC